MADQPVAGSPGPSRAWRVGDRDRDAAVEALGEHYATGRLTKSEYDERADLAYAARTDHDLVPLFADLPHPHPAAIGTAPPARTAPTGRPGAHQPHQPHQRRPGFAHRRRGPFGPWLLVVVPIAILTGAYWLVWLVPVLLWCVVRPARRHGRRGPAWTA